MAIILFDWKTIRRRLTRRKYERLRRLPQHLAFAELSAEYDRHHALNHESQAR